MSTTTRPSDVELDARVREILDALVLERRRLEGDPARSLELAANLLAIRYWREELGRLEADRSSKAATPNG